MGLLVVRGCLEPGLVHRHLAHSGGVSGSTSLAHKANQTKQAHNKLKENNGANTFLPRTLKTFGLVVLSTHSQDP